jgi:hypothetical protein
VVVGGSSLLLLRREEDGCWVGLAEVGAGTRLVAPCSLSVGLYMRLAVVV